MPVGKYKVLVVDSSSTNRQLIGDCLKQLPDVNILLATDGAQALAQISDDKPNLILVDLHLRDMDGIQLAKKIRTRELLCAEDELAIWTPIIFLSSIADDEIAARGIIAGGDDFLYKPVSEILLLAKVRAMLRIVGMQRNIFSAHQKLKRISTLDGLTCIPNRRYFDDTLAIEWKRCQRSQTPLSITLIDVDFFKQFNDIYGHQAGDHCLKAVANALSEALFRVEDCVARYGGEEFVAILPGTDSQGAFAVAERMLLSTRELSIPHEKGVGSLVSCSAGVASTLPCNEQTPQQLLQAADRSLYEAKRAGRNKVMINQYGTN